MTPGSSQENTDATTRRQSLQDLASVTEHFQEESIDVIMKTECIAEEKNGFTSKTQSIQDANNLTSGMQCSHEENIDLATKIQQLEHEKVDMANENENLLNENNKIKMENINLQKINELLLEDKNSLEGMASENGASVIHLLQQLRQAKLQAGNVIEQLRQEKSQSEKENQQLREEKCQSENDNEQLRQETIQLQTDNQQLQEDKPRTDNEIEQLRQEKCQLWNAIQKLRQKNSQLENENQQLRQEKCQSENNNQQLRQEKSQLQNENQQLREENTNRNNEIRRHKENNSNLSNEIQQLREENDGMSNEMQDFRQSMFTESGTVAVSNEVLGKGGWGVVNTGDFHGTKVAVKQFYEIILSPYNRKILEREIKIASQCRHPNLLQFICATQNAKNQLLIITELMDVALRTLIEQHATEGSRLKDQDVKSISLDVAKGLNYLHLKTPKRIIHRDVSSANVLLWIENDSVRRAKLSDYGSANFMHACNTANPGAALYAAPEARSAQHDPKVRTFESICKNHFLISSS